MLHAQVTPRAPPDGSSYQTLPTATPNHKSLHSDEMGLGGGPRGNGREGGGCEAGAREGQGDQG